MSSLLHPDLEPLAWLLGTWSGRGSGSYPTIEPFDYREEATFSHVGKPFLAYTQKTTDAATGLPLHSESGYLRPAGDRDVEFVVIQPSGIMEMHNGSFAEFALELRSSVVLTTPTAKSVIAVIRRIRLIDGVLDYEVDMEAVGQPMQAHLQAQLRKNEN